jgi:N-acetylglucosaminyl-diphospho-decaprenol L-rhamnosyltransferase
MSFAVIRFHGNTERGASWSVPFLLWFVSVSTRYAIGLTPQQNKEQPKQPPRVSVAVVSHNRCGLLRACLDSLEKSEGREAIQVIVVDNGSTDGSAQLDSEFPNVQFVRVPKNFGLTKAMNLGWRAADAPYVFFLHDDTELAPDVVTRLAEALDSHDEAAAVCPLLVNGDGQPAPQLGSLPPDGKWQPARTSGGAPILVEYPRGAALMMRVRLITAIRQIDERYGQFGADADLAVQIQRASKKILLVPELRVRHHGSEGYTPAERADFLLARAAYLGKYRGFAAGLQARIAAILGPLFGFRFGELSRTISGQKIDGTQ